VLCVGPSICSIIYLFCVGRLCCVGIVTGRQMEENGPGS